MIDVRTKKEFEFAHPKGAILIPIFEEKFGQIVENKNFIGEVSALLNSDHNKEIILICRSGSRTKYASSIDRRGI